MKFRSNWLILSGVLFLAPVCSGVSRTTEKPWHVQETPEIVSQTLRFSNGDAHLVGTLYLPASSDHLPAVVALHSASAATREASFYRHLSEALPTMGIAILLYDRRGTGESSGSVDDIDFGTLADDAIAGQRALAKTLRIDPKKIGFWGLSQGGWLAVLAATHSDDTAFAISISAPLVSPEQQMQFAMTNLMMIRGYSKSDIAQMLETRKAWTGYLRGTNSRESRIECAEECRTETVVRSRLSSRAADLTSDPEHNSYRKEMDDDPTVTLRSVRVPLLVLYGDSDPWIPVAKSIVQLRSIGHQMTNLTYAVVVNANHEMMFPTNETMQVDEKTVRNNAPQAPEYFMLLGSWLSRHLVH
jgi:pimeloyl-ACP methyl ester carboxylesterase